MKRVLRVAAAAMAVMASPALAAPSYDVRLFQIDDNMTVSISNSAFTRATVLTRGFGANFPAVDITLWIRPGTNTLSFALENTLSGWTYGYEVRRSGMTIASDACGTFNAFGCNNDSYDRGIVFRRDVSFTEGNVPEPATWAMILAGFTLIGTAARKRRPAKADAGQAATTA